jgi:peptide/nickel transport system substrate-binding protein
MTGLRRWKIFYLVIIQLAQKYTKALGIGFVAGLSLSLLFWKIYPFLSQQFLSPVDRIGIIGEFTPNSLPLNIQKQISLGLTDTNMDGSVIPALATSWVATDSGKTFTFYIRSDLKWHDGKSVTPKDINYNIKNVTFSLVGTTGIKAILNNPYSPFPSLVSKPLFQPGLKGFGPYKVSGIRLSGDKVSFIKLVPVDSTTPLSRSKEYRFYRTEASAVLAYKMGEIDEIDDLTSSYDLGTWGKTKIEETTKYNRIVTLFYNLTDSQLKDKNIRQGLGFGVPQLAGERAYSPIAKTSWAYTDKVKKYVPDMVQAKKLLPDLSDASQSATLTITTFSQYIDLAQKIADSWKNIGYVTNVKVVNTIPSNYQILLSTQEVPPDPDQYPFWHSTQTQTNITGFSNVKIDKLLEDGRQELDTEKRKLIYADFQRRITDEAPAIFLYYAKSYTIKRR